MASADNSKTRHPAAFPPGKSGNPGGRPKKLVEIEAMLDAEHRTVENMRAVFAQLKLLAPTDSRFMALYLDRILGPVKELKVDLTDAPPEVLEFLADRLN